MLDDGLAQLAGFGIAIELISGEGLYDVFHVVSFLFAEFGA